MVNRLVDQTKDLLSYRAKELQRLDEIDAWLNSVNYSASFIKAGKRNTPEKRALRELAETPLLRLIVEETAQQMILSGVSTDSVSNVKNLFAPWAYNGMPSREGALWEAALSYGYAYMMVLPAMSDSPLYADGRAWMRPYSPRNLFTLYGDVSDDEYPIAALRVIPQPGGTEVYRLYDEECVHFLGREKSGEIQLIESRPHNLGIVPVVQFASDKDLEGRTFGEVEKNKTGVKRLIKTLYDRLLIQHHNSWRIIYATGMEVPNDAAEREEAKMKLANDSVLTGEEGVSFGSLPETQLSGILQAVETDVHMLAATSQTPVWTFNGGQLVNLSADALAEARSTQRNKIRQKKKAMGRSIAEVLRLASLVEGRVEDANDFSITAQWEDVESRSLSQAADALGKMAQSLSVPPEKLWDMIPGVTPQMAEDWREYIAANPAGEERLAAIYEQQLSRGSGI